MAILAGNAGQVEERRGALGPLNALGDRLLAAAHAARANTRAGKRELFFCFFSFFFFVEENKNPTTTANFNFPFFAQKQRKKTPKVPARTSRRTTTPGTTCTASSWTRR